MEQKTLLNLKYREKGRFMDATSIMQSRSLPDTTPALSALVTPTGLMLNETTFLENMFRNLFEVHC